MIGTQCEHDPEAACGLKRHQKINERSTLRFWRFCQQFLELIHDQQSFRLADRQIAANRISRLARVRSVYALTQRSTLFRGLPEPFRRFGYAAFQALNRIAAGTHDDDMPYAIVRLAACGIGEFPAAKGGNKPGLGERRLAGTAVRDDRDQPMPLQLRDKLGDLILSAEESIRIRFRHRLKAHEGTVEHDGFLAGGSAENGPQELGE